MHSHEIPEKTHPLLLSKACQANRLRDGSVTLDDYDAQSLEVARQVGTGLFMIGIDHLLCDEYASNLLLNDLVNDFDNELGINSAARDSDQSNSLVLSHMRWLMFAVVKFRGVCSRPIRLS